MSPLTKAKKEEVNSKLPISKILLPAYVLLSLVFILYIGYSYIQGVVYNSGIINGQTAGQQQGYEAAVIELMNKVSEKCEPVALTMEDTQIDVINVACFQQSPATDIVSDDVAGE